MLWRLISLLFLLIVAGENLAASFSFSYSETTNPCCHKAISPETHEKQSCSMACCAQGKSPLGSPVAKVCCDTKCGGHSSDNSGAQPESVKQTPAPSLSFLFISLPNWLLLDKFFPPGRFPEQPSSYSQPTELYLHNSTLLI